MVDCWASSLGSCSEKQSREHIVSESMFLVDSVRVQGFPWCKEPKEIGLNSLTAKILCEKHNNQLCDLDTAGSNAIKEMREMSKVLDLRRTMRPQLWKVLHYHIDGLLLERWFLKTLINIAYEREYPIGKHNITGKPSEELVRIVFGLAPFAGRAGLYSMAHVGEEVKQSDSLAFGVLIKNNLFIGGGLFTFRGLRFFLFLLPEGPPTLSDSIWLPGEDMGVSSLNFHLRRLEMFSGKHRSQVVDFDWS